MTALVWNIFLHYTSAVFFLWNALLLGGGAFLIYVIKTTKDKLTDAKLREANQSIHLSYFAKVSFVLYVIRKKSISKK